MIDLTTLRRLHEAATEGPWATENKGPKSDWGIVASIGIWAQSRWDAAYELNPDDVDEADDACWIAGIWGEISDEEKANAALIELAPDLAAAVLDHPAALRAAMIRGYEVALEEAYRNGIGLPRADKCAALLDILKEYPDAH